MEDDGLGIPPSEFGESGGLGKLYREFRDLHLHPTVPSLTMQTHPS